MADDPIILITENSRLAASPKEIAAYLAIHPRHVYAAIKSGALQTYRCGTKSRVLTSDATAWVQSWPKGGPS
jgi:excisionase family DNA binding protein